MLQVITLLLLLNISTACNKENSKISTSSLSQGNCGDAAIMNKLIGKWQWVYGISYGDFYAGIQHISPTQCHCSKGLIFSNSCTYQDILNNNVGNPGDFIIKYDSTNYSYSLCTYRTNSPQFNNLTNCYTRAIVFNADTLVLTDGNERSNYYSKMYYVKN